MRKGEQFTAWAEVMQQKAYLGNVKQYPEVLTTNVYWTYPRTFWVTIKSLLMWVDRKYLSIEAKLLKTVMLLVCCWYVRNFKYIEHFVLFTTNVPEWVIETVSAS